MTVLINFKICDNAKECYGIEVCPTQAFFWDEKNKTIAVDESKCNFCGKCEKACEVDAIHIARTQEEAERIQKEIDNDPRKASDLFVDRYGAQPVSNTFLTDKNNFSQDVLEAGKLTFVEFFKEDSIMCLLYSIPVKDLFDGIDIKFRKMEIKDNSILDKYEIKKLPALLFFRNGEMIGNVQGYFENKDKLELKEKINEII